MNQRMIAVQIDGRDLVFDVDPEMPLLWLLRDHAGLFGVKYGCGMGLCRNCAVMLDDDLVASCQVPVARCQGRRVRTIAWYARQGHPVIELWKRHAVPQCGYCQPAQILTVIDLYERRHALDAAQIQQALSSVLCRCGTYSRISRVVDELLGGQGARSGA